MTVAFAVSTDNFKAKVIPSGGTLYDENNGNNTVEVEAGMMLQIMEQMTARLAIVRIKDYYNPDATNRESMVQCQTSQYHSVPDDLWPFVIAILDPQERLKFVRQPGRLSKVRLLRQDQIVKVSGKPFRRPMTTYDCIIRYCGPVSEIGPGYYFGLELLVM